MMAKDGLDLPPRERCVSCGTFTPDPCTGPSQRVVCPNFERNNAPRYRGASPWPTYRPPVDPITYDDVLREKARMDAELVENVTQALGPQPGDFLYHPPEPDDDSMNPKDRVGRLKIDLSLYPPAGIIHGAHAMMDGAKEYGPYNWRTRKVRARVYVAAAIRHLQRYLDGEDIDPKSKAHHLGHAQSCMAIILDAAETGNLVDDRPPPGRASQLLERLNAQLLAEADDGP